MLHVIKAGGNVADTPELLSDFLKAFAAFPNPKFWYTGAADTPRALPSVWGCHKP